MNYVKMNAWAKVLLKHEAPNCTTSQDDIQCLKIDENFYDVLSSLLIHDKETKARVDTDLK